MKKKNPDARREQCFREPWLPAAGFRIEVQSRGKEFSFLLFGVEKVTKCTEECVQLLSAWRQIMLTGQGLGCLTYSGKTLEICGMPEALFFQSVGKPGDPGRKSGRAPKEEGSDL